MKKTISIIIAIICLASAYSQSDISTLKKAYKYRTDISDKVLKMTKKWPEKVGVLHSDWIENRNGKSMDLEGNVLFPEYNYTHLERHGDFWIMTVDNWLGLLDKDGNKVTEFEYTGFDFTHLSSGYILCHKNTGATTKIRLYERNNYNDLCQADEQTFSDNGWIDRFRYYYNNEEYKKARFCLDFFNVYDRSTIRCAYSLPYFQSIRYSLLIYEKNEDYQDVIDIVQHGNLPSLVFDPDSDQLSLSKDNYYPPLQYNEISDEIKYLNENYLTCKMLNDYKIKQRAERQERLAVAAALLVTAAAVTTAAVVTEQQAQKAQQKSTSTSASKPKKEMSKVAQSFRKEAELPASSNNDAVDEGDDDPNYGEVEVEEIHVTCDRCGGSGVCPECGGTGLVDGVGNEKTSCGCKHAMRGKCVGCRGRGYNIKYK